MKARLTRYIQQRGASQLRHAPAVFMAALALVAFVPVAQAKPDVADAKQTTTAAPNATQGKGPKVTGKEFQWALQAQATLYHLSNGKSRVLEFFDGPDGLIGLVGYNETTDNKFIAWTTRTGKTLIIGPVISETRNLTAFYQKKAIRGEVKPIMTHDAHMLRGEAPPGKAKDEIQHKQISSALPDFPYISKTLYEKVQGAEGLTVGVDAKHLYMFYDPNCPWCARTKNMLEDKVDQGKVMVTYIPVGALGLESRKASAAILTADNRLKALNLTTGELADRTSTPKAIRNVRQNTTLMIDLAPRPATPTLVMLEKDTGRPYVTQGMPRNLDALIQRIKPLPSKGATTDKG